MLNLLRADFYKLLRRKSFYICGILGIIVACLYVFFENMNLNISLQSVNMQLDSLPAVYRMYFSGVSAFTRTISFSSIFVTIMVSMFISSEFSFGTIKNIISAGKSRVSIYTSKLIMALVISTIYILLVGLAGFTMGSIFWGVGEITRTEYLEIFRVIGLIIAVEFSMQALFTMISFIVRTGGASITINLIIGMILPEALPYLNVAFKQVFSLEEFNVMKYWPYTYLGAFSQFEIATEQLTLGLTVCAVTLVASTLIGMFTFQKRDI
mgnify:CR=1 FL=1